MIVAEIRKITVTADSNTDTPLSLETCSPTISSNVFSLVMVSLYLNLKFQLVTIDYSISQYNNMFSKEHIQMLHDKMNTQFEDSKTNLIISTSILSAGVAISFLSLISYQRKMITRYNEV